MAAPRRVFILALLFAPGVTLAADPAPETETTAAPAAPAPEHEAAPVAPPDKPPPAHEPAVPPSGFAWEPFGFLRLQYLVVQDDPNVAFVGRSDGFEMQNARIGARGRLGTRASFVISFDGAVDERAQVNSPQGKLAVGLRDAYADLATYQAMFVRVGYFQTWVDPQVQIGDTARELVDLPIETRGMRATEGWQTPGLPPGRSLGAALRVDPASPVDGARIGFEVAAQNGADEFSSNNDNDQLALSAAVVARFPRDGFIVVAGRYNPRTIGDLPFRQDETDLQGSVGAHIVAGPISLGAAGILQHTTYDTTAGPANNAYGAHAQAMFRIPADYPIALGYRIGVLDPSDRLSYDMVIEHTVGAVMGVPSLRMRLQLQAVHVQEQQARELDNDRVQLAMEVVL